MYERLQELLNRKPKSWLNLTLYEFERDMKILKETIIEQQNTIKTLQKENKN